MVMVMIGKVDQEIAGKDGYPTGQPKSMDISIDKWLINSDVD